MEFNKKLILKITFNGDIRRLPVHNEDLTYNELILMLQRIFKQYTISSDDDLVVKYSDVDGDLVTIVDDSDLLFAIQECNRVLKLTVTYKNKGIFTDAADGITCDLKEQLITLKNALDGVIEGLNKEKDHKIIEVVRKEASTIESNIETKKVNGDMNKCQEFDPLHNNTKVMEVESNSTCIPSEPEPIVNHATSSVVSSVAQLELNTSGITEVTKQQTPVTSTTYSFQQGHVAAEQPTMKFQPPAPAVPFNMSHQEPLGVGHPQPNFPMMNSGPPLNPPTSMIPPTMSDGTSGHPPMFMRFQSPPMGPPSSGAPPQFGPGRDMGMARPPPHHFRPQHMPTNFYQPPPPHSQAMPPQLQQQGLPQGPPLQQMPPGMAHNYGQM